MLAKRALTEEIHHRTLCFPRTTITPCNVEINDSSLEIVVDRMIDLYMRCSQVDRQHA